jgi:hypothetical protein
MGTDETRGILSPLVIAINVCIELQPPASAGFCREVE